MTALMIPAPHQVEDSDALLEYEHGFLWADPGTGKTLTAIEGFRKGGYRRMVVICPKIAVEMWHENLTTQLGMKYVQPIRSGRLPKRCLTKDGRGRPPIQMADALIVSEGVITNKNVQGIIRDFALQCDIRSKKPTDEKEPCLLVVDESHYFKSVTAKRAQALHGVRSNLIGGIAYYFTDVWQLTGTPITRHADDLFMQLHAYRKDILKHYNVETYQKFTDKFCVQKMKKFAPHMPARLVVTGSRNQQLLAQLLKDCRVIRRRLRDVIDGLPPLTERVIEVGYKNVENVHFKNPTDLIRELNKPDSHAAKVRRQLGIAKVHDIAEYILEHGDKPVLIGYWHTDVRMELIAALEEHGTIAVISGSTGPKEREDIIAKFNMGLIDYLIGQIAAMGVAINLQGMCSHIVIAEVRESPSELEQFIARVYRRGQKRHVQVDHMVSNHDLDGAIRHIRLDKASTIKEVI